MSEDLKTSIIDIGELSRPATVLIEKISDAVGGLFKPYQIVRVAKAEAQAEQVRVQTQIDISDIQRRAFHRFLEEEGKKQRNIEEITRKTLPQLEEDSNPAQVEDDWITNFFDRCRLISDEQMQSLWSRVLAGEANSPGTYSKRTVNFLSALDKSDAELFTQLCGFAWRIAGEITPLVYDYDHEIYDKYNLNFASLSHLDSIGLVRFDGMQSFIGQVPRLIRAFYHGTSVLLRTPGTDSGIKVGKVALTKIGDELAQICGSDPVDGFVDYICDKWRSFGYLLLEHATHEANQPEF